MEQLKEIFKDKQLFEQALTHKSWINEHPGVRNSNERLEFLGDAVLEFCVSEEIYKRFPKEEEGFLTALRSNLVNTVNLATISRKLALGQALFLSKGEEEGGGRDNPSLLADTLEAVIGALFLDQGLKAVEKFLQTNMFTQIDEKASKPLKDAKSRLQEIVQAKGFPAPKYIVISEKGPDHAKEFVVEVMVDNKAVSQGGGKSKSEAEQTAATNALDKSL